MLKMEIAFDKEKIEREDKYDIDKMWAMVDEYFRANDIPITVIDDYTHVFQSKKSNVSIFFSAFAFKRVNWFVKNLYAWKWIDDSGTEDILKEITESKIKAPKTLTMGKSKVQKLVWFSLSKDALKKAGFPLDMKPYNDIRKAMKELGFEHLKKLTYQSKHRMNTTDWYDFIIELDRKLPWLSDCVTKMHVADIANEKTDLRPLLGKSTLKKT